MGHHLDHLDHLGHLNRRDRRARSAVVLLLTCALVVAAAVGSGAAAWTGVASASDAPAATGSSRVEVAFTPILSLALSEQPRTATLNTAIDPPVVVTVVDASGTPVPDAGIDSVEVSLRNPPGVLGLLGGQTSVPVVDGEAILDDLRIRTTGQGYHLDVEAALDGTWLEVASEPFAVAAASSPRPGHVDAVDCAQAAPGTGLLHLDGRRVEAALVVTDDARGVRLEHPEVAPSLSVRPAGPDHGPPPADVAAVSGRSLLLAADEALSVLAGRLLPSSPVGVWLLGDPSPIAPWPVAWRVAAPDAEDAHDDAAMVEVTSLGTLRVTAAGTLQGTLTLPDGLTPGAFTVQLVGTLADGRSMLASTGVLLTPPPFPDVDSASVHAPAIRRITALGISTGRPDASYGPATTVTRGQLASFLARALELDTGGQSPFPDARNSVHGGAVAAVAEAGIASGYADGSFGVGDPIRRDQMAAMLAAAAGLTPQPEGPFGDVAGNAHAPAVNAVAAAGITLGDGQGRYRPADPVRRDQLASFLVRLLDVRLLDHDG